MILVIKLTSFAWSAFDGRRPDNELDPTQRRSKITETPSLLTFLGYA
jgi:lysophospholipid acyltransferase